LEILLMFLDSKQIDHLAKLARLALSQKEKELYAGQLAAVLEYFKKLQALDTVGLEPMSQVIELKNIFRVDEIKDCSPDTQKKILENAPGRTGQHLKVQKIL